MLDPVAVAPERVETEAVYCPFDSCTLPEYCLPCTVVEKLVVCISSAALLLLPPPPPPPEREVFADEVVVDAVLVEAVLDDALAVVDEAGVEAAVDRLTATGFSTVAVEAADEMLRICMALPPELRSIQPLSFFGGFGPSFREKFSLQVIARARRMRGCSEPQREPVMAFPGLLYTHGKRHQPGTAFHLIALRNNLQRRFLHFRGDFLQKALIPGQFIIICKFPQAKINIGGGVGGGTWYRPGGSPTFWTGSRSTSVGIRPQVDLFPARTTD
jgi:hypothetical protein